MPPLASDLVADTRRLLYSGYQDEQNELSGAITDIATTLNLAYDPIGISRGTILSIGLEELYVWQVSTRQVTVRRGASGSTATAHADRALIHVRPKFSDFRIFGALNDELRDLSSPQNGLYQMRSTDITLTAARVGYDLPADLIEVYEIRQAPGTLREMNRVKSFTVTRGANALDVATGNALLVHDPVGPGRITVRYKAAFTLLTGLTQDVPAVTGLPPTAMDIPPLGAAIRLVAPREVKRAFTESQGEPRRADEVPPGASTGSLRGLSALRQQRVLAEAARLQAMYPPIFQFR